MNIFFNLLRFVLKLSSFSKYPYWHMRIVLDKFFFMKRIILFLCVLVFSIFSNTNNLLAKEIENNIKENISNEIEEIKPDNKKNNISNSSAEDIFGDEQTFPFVAGLGKNAAH